MRLFERMKKKRKGLNSNGEGNSEYGYERGRRSGVVD
jgi:hypothetical protein